MPDIILSTLNAKYIHASLGLRYLYANLKTLKESSEVKEFTIQNRAIDIVEKLLEKKPKIIGFGVYIWNVIETEAVISQLKTISPETIIILGGPEVSYEIESQSILNYADYVITGAADLSFYQLCSDILTATPPNKKILNSKPIDLNELRLPYDYYSDEDLRNRLLYVEASRGCPFKCEFCLSSLDKTAYPFELESFFMAMDKLYQRGARHFKFVDRTFNLKIKTTLAILDFFLERMDEKLFLHFEVIPDHLPEKLKEVLVKFPPGCLQFEIGIQTFNPEVQQLISRKQNNQKSKDNLIWIRNHTKAHIHADLIFGLPGETLDTFKQSFDELYACNPHEIQLGILKRLKGSPIIRHTQNFSLRFNPQPPFNILRNDRVDFTQMQQVNRFARYWDMIANSGRFTKTMPYLLSEKAFDDFMAISQWLFEKTQQTHQINLKRLYELVAQATQKLFPERHSPVLEALEQDYKQSKLKGRFDLLNLTGETITKTTEHYRHAKRQQRHI
jgi:radical SAM superfamily enzyme YgiQ (UPF0313 family)